MSRIGKIPVTIPANISAQLENNTITFKGPKGELVLTSHPLVSIAIQDNQIRVARLEDSKIAKSLHGLYRTLISNMIQGVSQGFEKKLEIEGVGYRVQIQGKNLIFSLGFSHPVNFPIPNGIEIVQDPEKKNLLSVRGIDKQLVGQCAANIRNLKKPEPYKGKGIRYFGEIITRKAGKSAVKEK